MSTTPATGPLSMTAIATEFDGTAPHKLSEYYGVATGVPESGTIKFSDLRGKSSDPASPSVGVLAFDKTQLSDTNDYQSRLWFYDADTASLARITLQSFDGSTWYTSWGTEYTNFISVGTNLRYTTWEFKISKAFGGRAAETWYPLTSAYPLTGGWGEHLDQVLFTMREIAVPSNEASIMLYM